MFMFFFTTAPIFAQTDDDKDFMRKISLFEETRKAHIAKSMQFTEQEAGAFWSVFSEYQEALRPVIVGSVKLISAYLKEHKTLSDEKAAAMINEFLVIEKEKLALKETYLRKFGKILPPRKVMRLLQLELATEVGFNYEVVLNLPPAN
jgi:hypothetical protein